MKKFVALLSVVALLTGAFAADAAWAAPKDKEPKEKSNNRDNENNNRNHDKHDDKEKSNQKVLVCHVSETLVMIDGTTILSGKVISISENALEAHLAHGDILAPEGAVKGEDWWTVAPGGTDV